MSVDGLLQDKIIRPPCVNALSEGKTVAECLEGIESSMGTLQPVSSAPPTFTGTSNCRQPLRRLMSSPPDLERANVTTTRPDLDPDRSRTADGRRTNGEDVGSYSARLSMSPETLSAMENARDARDTSSMEAEPSTRSLPPVH